MNAILLGLSLIAPIGAPVVEGRYLVLVEPGPKDEYLPAAKRLADFHGAELIRFDSADLVAAFKLLKEKRPDFVAFVLPPDRIDVDLTHEILARSTRLDDDPFVDFEYAFVTGRDGPAAVRFVDSIRAAWGRSYGRKAALFGSWEGQFPPSPAKLSSMKALGSEASLHFVKTRDSAADQAKSAAAGLAACRDRDLLLFFSHGYPDEMAACFKSPDLKDWRSPGSILVNCACYNGAPGRWFGPGPEGVKDMEIVAKEKSVCLAILDSGVAGYVAGVDPWHGPLAFQMTGLIFDDGLRLGHAAKAMQDRLALAFLPDRIEFPPTLKNPKRFTGEGRENRRHNGAGMIVYGDPAFAPFAKAATRTFSAKFESVDRLTLAVGRQVDGVPGEDVMLPMARLTNYYSVASADVFKELSLEIYRVIGFPKSKTTTPKLTVKSAKCGADDVPTKDPVVVVEDTSTGRRLHVRVPLDVRAYGTPWTMKIIQSGITIEIDCNWNE